MAQTADAHDTDTVCGSDSILSQAGPDGGTGTHQGRRVGGVITIWDFEDVAGVPDDTAAEGTEVMVVGSIFLFVDTVLVPACQDISYLQDN